MMCGAIAGMVMVGPTWGDTRDAFEEPV
jgi:hypothetical protein